jgi:hypothetical protein
MLAFGLCLLAVMFALEAKTAWYGPATGPRADVQSQKALPADLPTVVSHGVSALGSTALPMILMLVAAVAGVEAGFLRGIDVDFNRVPVFAAPYFSPGLFFRPPPQL